MIRRGEPKAVDDLGYQWRVCARAGCGSKFRPSDTISGQSTEFYCGSECALAAWRARHGRNPRDPWQDDGGEG